jgi:hypothetical protein
MMRKLIELIPLLILNIIVILAAVCYFSDVCYILFYKVTFSIAILSCLTVSAKTLTFSLNKDRSC